MKYRKLHLFTRPNSDLGTKIRAKLRKMKIAYDNYNVSAKAIKTTEALELCDLQRSAVTSITCVITFEFTSGQQHVMYSEKGRNIDLSEIQSILDNAR